MNLTMNVETSGYCYRSSGFLAWDLSRRTPNSMPQVQSRRSRNLQCFSRRCVGNSSLDYPGVGGSPDSPQGPPGTRPSRQNLVPGPWAQSVGIYINTLNNYDSSSAIRTFIGICFFIPS